MSTLDKKIARLERQMRQRPHDKQAERAYYRLVKERTEWLHGLYLLWPAMKPKPMTLTSFDAVLKSFYNDTYIKEMSSALKHAPWLANLGRDKY